MSGASSVDMRSIIGTILQYNVDTLQYTHALRTGSLRSFALEGVFKVHRCTDNTSPATIGAASASRRSPAHGEEKLHQALVAEEGDGVDGEGPHAVEQQPLEEDPQPLLSDAQPNAVQDPAVLAAAGP